MTKDDLISDAVADLGETAFKETSLAGIQRPLESNELDKYRKHIKSYSNREYEAEEFFRFGDFFGMIVYRKD